MVYIMKYRINIFYEKCGIKNFKRKNQNKNNKTRSQNKEIKFINKIVRKVRRTSRHLSSLYLKIQFRKKSKKDKYFKKLQSLNNDEKLKHNIFVDFEYDEEYSLRLLDTNNSSNKNFKTKKYDAIMWYEEDLKHWKISIPNIYREIKLRFNREEYNDKQFNKFFSRENRSNITKYIISELYQIFLIYRTAHRITPKALDRTIKTSKLKDNIVGYKSSTRPNLKKHENFIKLLFSKDEMYKVNKNSNIGFKSLEDKKMFISHFLYSFYAHKVYLPDNNGKRKKTTKDIGCIFDENDGLNNIDLRWDRPFICRDCKENFLANFYVNYKFIEDVNNELETNLTKLQNRRGHAFFTFINKYKLGWLTTSLIVIPTIVSIACAFIMKAFGV